MFRTTSIHCGCALDVEYDSAKRGEYQLVGVPFKCADHKDVGDDRILDVLYGPKGECRTWTTFRNVLLSPEIGLLAKNADGQVEPIDGCEPQVWFEGEASSRVMKYAILGDAVSAKKIADVVAAVEAVAEPGATEVVEVAKAVEP